MESKKNNRSKKSSRVSGPDKRDVEESNLRFPIREPQNLSVKVEGRIYNNVGDYTADVAYASDYMYKVYWPDDTWRRENYKIIERKEDGKRKRKEH